MAQQRPAKITGRITDEGGKPISYAAVGLMKEKDSALVKGSIADENGLFTIEGVPDGIYQVAATMSGYQRMKSAPFVISDSVRSIQIEDLALGKETKQLEEVTVAGRKPVIERRIDMLVLHVENSILAIGNTALDILKRAPGVSVGANGDIGLRGKEGTTIMINGKLTYMSQSELTNLLGGMDGSTISSVEIIANPSAKFDAAGSGGIINIKMKKNRMDGTNGMITAGTGYGADYKANTGLNLNYRNKSLNIFGNYSYKLDKSVLIYSNDREEREEDGKTKYFRQRTRTTEYKTSNHNYKLGMDYTLNPRNIFGVIVSGYSNRRDQSDQSVTYVSSMLNGNDSSVALVKGGPVTSQNLAYNVNYKSLLDTLGQELSIDLDYVNFSSELKKNYINSFYGPDNTPGAHPPTFLQTIAPIDIDIYSFKADYVKPLRNKFLFSAGVKSSWVKTHNDFGFYSFEGTEWIKDGGRSNVFIYKENINAAYLNIHKKTSKDELQVGLRAEQTNSNGNSITENKIVDRSYLSFFPNISYTHTFSDDHAVNLGHSRRVDRPQYEELNPFAQFVDQYLVRKGNPFLKPMYTTYYDASYTFKKKYIFSFEVSFTKDQMVWVVLPDTASTIVNTRENLARKVFHSFNAFVPVSIGNWWDMNNNLTVYYRGFKTSNIIGNPFESEKVTFYISSNNIFRITKTITGELSARFTSAQVIGTAEIYKPLYSADISLNKSFANEKANLKIALSDIFNNEVLYRRGLLPAPIYSSREKAEVRVIRLTFNYNFGGKHVKPSRRRKVGAEDEMQRTN
jgi:hypothetical protein